MKTRVRKLLFFFFVSVVFINAQNLFAQKKPSHINLHQIILILSTQNGKSAKEINTNLIEEIRKNKVNFILSAKDENTLKNLGASDVLIIAINENASKETKEEFAQKLYALTICNEPCTQSNSEQIIGSSKQFIKVFENDPNYELQVRYLKKAIPKLEESFANNKLGRGLYKTLTESIVKNIESDEIKKDLTGKFIRNHMGNIEEKKIALEAAKEFVGKFSEELEIKEFIDYLKTIIPILEKQITP